MGTVLVILKPEDIQSCGVSLCRQIYVDEGVHV